MGHHVAAHHVDHGEGHGGRAEDRRQLGIVGAARDDGTDQGDAADGVRAGHERSVQRRRHLGDDFEADEDRQHEHG